MRETEVVAREMVRRLSASSTARHARHVDVHQNDIKVRLLDSTQCLVPVESLVGLNAMLLENLEDELLLHRMVVDCKNEGERVCG